MYGPDQRKRALARLARARIGRNPRDRAGGHFDRGGAGEHRGASTGFRPAVLCALCPADAAGSCDQRAGELDGR